MKIPASVLKEIAEVYRGKTIAFTPILRDQARKWGLGVAEKGKPGYTPLPRVRFDDYGSAALKADELNKVGLKLDMETAMSIVSTSIAHGRYREHVRN